jgi:hypothetical protein
MSTMAEEGITGRDATLPRWSNLAFWTSTLFVAVTALLAGILDILRTEPLFGTLLHLGYPPYFSAILGTWKVLGAIALVAPRIPLLKEWAYAGMFFDYSSAIVSYLASGDEVLAVAWPVVSIIALILSWWLRPPPRRLPFESGPRSKPDLATPNQS